MGTEKLTDSELSASQGQEAKSDLKRLQEAGTDPFSMMPITAPVREIKVEMKTGKEIKESQDDNQAEY